jgi:hypothetical protein
MAFYGTFSGHIRTSNANLLLSQLTTKFLILGLLLAVLSISVSAQTPPGGYTSPASGSSSGSGITQVTSLTLPCTANSQVQLTVASGTNGVGNYICISGQWIQAGLYGPGVIFGASFGLVPGFIAWDCGVTSGSPNVVCTNTTFTSANIGWLAHATGPNTTGAGGPYLTTLNGGAETTIIGCSPSCPSHTAILATNNNTTVGSGVAFTTGPDMTANLTSLFSAAWNTPTSAPNCLAVVLSGGIYMTKTGQGNTATCSMQSSGSGDTQAAVVSWSSFSGMLAPTQDFNFTTGAGQSCGGGISNNTCFWSVQGIRLQNVGINGGNANLTGQSPTVNVIEIRNDSAMLGVYCVGWGGASSGNMQGVLVNSGAQAIQWSQIDGCGEIALKVNAAVLQIISDSFFGDTGAVGSITGSAAIFAANTNSFGNGYAGCTVGVNNVQVSITAPLFTSYGDALQPCGSKNNTGAQVSGSSRSYFFGLTGTVLGTASTNALVFTGTSSGGCSGCSLSAQSGGFGLAVVSTAKFYSGGMNTIVGTNIASTASMLFTRTDSVTAGAATLGHIMVAADFTPTTNFGTGCATAGQCISAVTGDEQEFSLTITYGTGPASPQTLTVAWPMAFPTAPYCQLWQIGGTNSFLTSIANSPIPTTTTGTFVISNTPIAGDTVILNGRCGRTTG